MTQPASDELEIVGYTTESVIDDIKLRPSHNHTMWGEPMPGHPDIALVRASDARKRIRAQDAEIKRKDVALAGLLQVADGVPMPGVDATRLTEAARAELKGGGK